MSESGKRYSIRKIKRLPITFSDGKEELNGTSSDFSSTGLFIRTRRPCKPGTHVKMTLEINETRKISLAGVVARSIKTGSMVFKNGMGIKLTLIPKEYEDFINSFH